MEISTPSPYAAHLWGAMFVAYEYCHGHYGSLDAALKHVDLCLEGMAAAMIEDKQEIKELYGIRNFLVDYMREGETSRPRRRGRSKELGPTMQSLHDQIVKHCRADGMSMLDARSEAAKYFGLSTQHDALMKRK